MIKKVLKLLDSLLQENKMSLFRSVSRLASLSSKRQFSTSLKRQGDEMWNYRTTPPATTQNLQYISKGIMTFTWWRIFHGIFTEPAHILPFWDNYPDPEQWTDAQLGIPPDDE